jgi:hypothetical protein
MGAATIKATIVSPKTKRRRLRMLGILTGE